jgi:hypothetical protein
MMQRCRAAVTEFQPPPSVGQCDSLRLDKMVVQVSLRYCHSKRRYYTSDMKTITIKVPDFLNASLDAAAASRKKTKSQIVRDLLLSALHAPSGPTSPRKPTRPSLHDRLQKYQGAGPTGVRDLGSNPKHLAGYGRE